MIEGSLTFPHSYYVSQLDAVKRHTQDQKLVFLKKNQNLNGIICASDRIITFFVVIF